MNWLKNFLSDCWRRRNELKLCFTDWNLPIASATELAGIDAIVGASFGLPYDLSSNVGLAYIALNNSEKYEKPMILQWELADCLLNNPRITPNLMIALIIEPQPGKYLNSYHVAKQADQECRENRWKKVAVVAYTYQQLRLGMTLKKFGLEVVYIDTTAVKCDRKSEQLWTRSNWLFVPRELVGQILYWYRHYI